MKIKHEDLIMPIGKYKGQKLVDAITDEGYKQWLLAQEFIKADYPVLYDAITNPKAEYNNKLSKRVNKYLLKREICKVENITTGEFNYIMMKHGYLRYSYNGVHINSFTGKKLNKIGATDKGQALMIKDSGSWQHGTYRYNYTKLKSVFEMERQERKGNIGEMIQ